MIERIRLIQNPLTIIAIFAGLAEVAGTTALALVDKELQGIFIWFVMGFPILLICLFFLTLNFNPTVLYAPSDFKDEQNFVHLLYRRRKLTESMEMVTKKIEENYSDISKRLIGEVKSVRETDHQNLVDYLKHTVNEIRDQLASVQKSADEVVSEAGRQAFPQSKLQTDILEFISSSKHSMTADQIRSALGMSDSATSRALDRLCKRGLITCEKDGGERVYSMQFLD